MESHMDTNNLNFDIYAMAKPKSRADLIVLAKEALYELEIINGYLDAMYEECDSPTEA